MDNVDLGSNALNELRNKLGAHTTNAVHALRTFYVWASWPQHKISHYVDMLPASHWLSVFMHNHSLDEADIKKIIKEIQQDPTGFSFNRYKANNMSPNRIAIMENTQLIIDALKKDAATYGPEFFGGDVQVSSVLVITEICTRTGDPVWQGAAAIPDDEHIHCAAMLLKYRNGKVYKTDCVLESIWYQDSATKDAERKTLKDCVDELNKRTSPSGLQKRYIKTIKLFDGQDA